MNPALHGTHLRLTGGRWRLVYAARAFGPSFESREAAERFVAFVEGRTGLDCAQQAGEVLDALLQEFKHER